MVRHHLPKSERLSKRLAIEKLFGEGVSFSVGRLWVIRTHTLPTDWVSAPLMVAFAVPKRNFKRAVKRNLLKRRMREAFRRNKTELVQALVQHGQHRAILIKFHARKEATYLEIEGDMVRLLAKLKEGVV